MMVEKSIDVYIERGKKRTFAGAIDWPGWCRAGKDETAALQALIEYAPRYAVAMKSAGIDFLPPEDVAALEIVERLQGDVSTDFGAPGQAPEADAWPVDAAWLEQAQAIFQACRQVFDAAARAAEGKELRKGPRGGGRDLDKIIAHVVGGQSGYLNALGWKFKHDENADPRRELARVRKAVNEGLAAALRGELPALSPRGRKYWSPRYYLRRSAWHVLDHAWEIEDRTSGERD